MTAPEEHWRAVPGYEGLYQASDHGRVRSLPRPCTSGRILKAKIRSRDGHAEVALSKDGRVRVCSVHQLVMLAFVGARPEGLEIRHRNGHPADNRLSNLAYGTTSENHRDRVHHGVHHQTRKTHCPKNHPYSGDNLIVTAWGRRCRACERDRHRRQRAA